MRAFAGHHGTASLPTLQRSAQIIDTAHDLKIFSL
jgi:hypothetical protein